jgi:hypothetical protein
MRLYLDSPAGGVGPGGTVGVLVHHVRERVVEGYREFLDAVDDQQAKEEEGAEGQKGLLGVVKFGEVLSEVISEVDAGGQKFLVSPS